MDVPAPVRRRRQGDPCEHRRQRGPGQPADGHRGQRRRPRRAANRRAGRGRRPGRRADDAAGGIVGGSGGARAIVGRGPGGCAIARPAASAKTRTAVARSMPARRRGGSPASSASASTAPTAAGARAGSPRTTCRHGRRRRPRSRRGARHGWRTARGRRRAQPAAVAVGELREVRRGGARPAVADPAHLGPQPGPQLGDDPARHPQRRGRHHRARGLAQAPQRRARARRGQVHDGLLPRGGVRGGAQGVPVRQRLARRRGAGAQALLQHRLRRRHPWRPRRPGDQGRRPQGPARDRPGSRPSCRARRARASSAPAT